MQQNQRITNERYLNRQCNLHLCRTLLRGYQRCSEFSRTRDFGIRFGTSSSLFAFSRDFHPNYEFDSARESRTNYGVLIKK